MKNNDAKAGSEFFRSLVDLPEDVPLTVLYTGNSAGNKLLMLLVG